MQLIFDWANDPVTRQYSFNTERISWDEHRSWFKDQISGSDPRLVVIELETGGGVQQVGQLRVDQRGTVSFSMAPEFRNKGMGSICLRAAVLYIGQKQNLDRVFAYILPENDTSIRAFEKAGFRYLENQSVEGRIALKYVLILPAKAESQVQT